MAIINQESENSPKDHSTYVGTGPDIGSDYQARVAAYFGVHLLAEKDISVPWNTPSDVYVESILFQTKDAIDDLLLILSDSSLIYIQAKITIQRSTNFNSEFGKTIEQITNQYVIDITKLGENHSNKYVIVTSSSSPNTILRKTQEALTKIRSDQDIDLRNEEDNTSIEVISQHIRKSWETNYGKEPDQDTIINILRKMYIYKLDVFTDENHELESKKLLRSNILRNADDVDSAWAAILRKFVELAYYHGKIDRPTLQKLLSQTGIALKVVNSFRNDIDEINNNSKTTEKSLNHLSFLEINENQIKITREASTLIKEEAYKSHLLIIGEPGTGKSGILFEFVKTLQSGNVDYIYLSADSTDFKNIKSFLGIEHNFKSILENWNSTQVGFVIVDAVDSNRDITQQDALLDIFMYICNYLPRWHIVSSVRKYDLRLNRKIKNLFLGEPSIMSDPEFSNIHHINIDNFSEKEFELILNQSEKISKVYQYSSTGFQELLHNPYNLHILCEIISGETNTDLVMDINTQTELLSVYWDNRVITTSANRSAKEDFLKNLLGTMIENHEMSIKTREAQRINHRSSILDELLRDGILIELGNPIQGNQILFSHNLLFDYAVYKTHFENDLPTLIEIIENDNSLVISIRPSISLFFQYIWGLDQNHQSFWEAYIEFVIHPAIPKIGKIIGANIVIQLVNQIEDFHYLFEKIKKQSSTNELIENIIQFIIQSLISNENNIRTKNKLNIWAEFADLLSTNLTKTNAFNLRSLLYTIFEKEIELDFVDRKLFGQSARRLYDFSIAFENHKFYKFLGVYSLVVILRTFDTDPIEATKYVEKVIEPQHLQNFGYFEMSRVTHEIKYIINSSPELAMEVYKSCFSHEETSKEKTPMAGIILRMSSTRQQDFEGALFHLEEAFPYFLEKSSLHATLTIINVVNSYINKKSVGYHKEANHFVFNDISASIVEDCSRIWDNQELIFDNEQKMIQAFSSFIINLASENKNHQTLKEIVNIIAQNNINAVLWNHFLLIGIKFPDSFGLLIRDLAWAIPVMECFDTEYSAMQFVKTIYSHLTKDDKTKVENAILSVDETLRNRYLDSLQDIDFILPELKVIRSNNKINNENRLRILDSQILNKSFSTNTADKKISLFEDTNINTIYVKIEEFSNKYTHLNPSLHESEKILSLMPSFLKYLQTNSNSINQQYLSLSFGHCSKVCLNIAKIETLDPNSELVKQLKQFLIFFSNCRYPIPNPEYDLEFHKSFFFAEPAARLHAAAGLLFFSRATNQIDDEISRKIEELTDDPVPAVRYQISKCINVIAYSDPDFMWKIITKIATFDDNSGVISGLFDPLSRLIKENKKDTFSIANIILSRIAEFTNNDSITKIGVFVYLYLFYEFDHEESLVELDKLINNRTISTKIKNEIVFYSRRIIEEKESQNKESKAINLICKLTDYCLDTVNNLLSNRYEEFSEEDKDDLANVINLSESISNAIYSASGSYSEENPTNKEDKILSTEEKKFFLNDFKQIIVKLSKIPDPRIIYNLVKTLNSYANINPDEIFTMLGTIIENGKESDYAYDGLAIIQIVEILEKYLSEYNFVIKDNNEAQKILFTILDTFIDAGWPEAIKLCYGLEEIYR